MPPKFGGKKQVTVPSWSGRNALVLIEGGGRNSLSPSPHGRVGTALFRYSPVPHDASPSPHGRVGTNQHLRHMRQAYRVTVPSWSGRNEGDYWSECELVESPSPHGRVGTVSTSPKPFRQISRRPLMVGSELVLARFEGFCVSALPSPHGRVGTGFVVPDACEGEVSPSPHGRVGTRTMVCWCRPTTRSPSPYGRVGTLTRSF